MSVPVSNKTSEQQNGPRVSTPAMAPAPLTHKGVARRLGQYLKPHTAQIALGLLCAALVGAVVAGIAGLIERFIGSIAKDPDALRLAVVCLAVVLLYALKGILGYSQNILLGTVAQRVGLQLRRDVYAHLQSLSLSYFQRRRTGALMSALTNDIGKIQSAAMMLRDAVAAPIQAVILLVSMAIISWQLTLLSLIAVPLMALSVQRLTRRLRGISRQTQQKMADVASVMEETLSAPRVVRAFSAEPYEIARFEAENEAAVRLQLKGMRRSASLGPVVDLIGSFGVALMLYFGGLQVVRGQMEAGGLIAFFFLASQVGNIASVISGLRGNVEDLMGAADRIFTEVMDVEPEVRDTPDAVALPPVVGRIEFRDVSFAYEPGQPVLQNINLLIEPGEVVALVGETGAGKTTLADLVPRFYDPTRGQVLIDGHDLRSVTLQSLRANIGIVPQDTILFSGTIRDNIVYGRRDALEAEAIAAAKASNAHDFILSKPEGYQTWVGERGVTLSGGQKQRLAIARALLKDARILILDEATSALDAATEALVQGALDTLMEGRTTILIAHRLSTVVNADKIVVLRRGGIIAEVGTHTELMAKGGVYAALFEAQRRAATEAGSEPPARELPV